MTRLQAVGLVAFVVVLLEGFVAGVRDVDVALGQDHSAAIAAWPAVAERVDEDEPGGGSRWRLGLVHRAHGVPVSQIGTAEECWQALVEETAAASSMAELLVPVLEALGQRLHAEARPQPVDVALAIGDVSRLIDLLVEHRDVMVDAVRGTAERMAS